MNAVTASAPSSAAFLPELRRIPTRDAEVWVPWNAGCVRQVLRQRGITADDFDAAAPSLQAFVRDLVPLAAQDALAGVPDRRLGRLVRALFRRLHGGAAQDAAGAVASRG